VKLRESCWVAVRDSLSEALDAAVQRAALAARLRVPGRRAKRLRDVPLAAADAIPMATARLVSLRQVRLLELPVEQSEAEYPEWRRAVRHEAECPE
jgi:hypothetical protein